MILVVWRHLIHLCNFVSTPNYFSKYGPKSHNPEKCFVMFWDPSHPNSRCTVKQLSFPLQRDTKWKLNSHFLMQSRTLQPCIWHSHVYQGYGKQNTLNIGDFGSDYHQGSQTARCLDVSLNLVQKNTPSKIITDSLITLPKYL